MLRARLSLKRGKKERNCEPGDKRNSLACGCYFGRTLGSPPGLPGGGITAVLPVSGVGARISGSTPAGGHSTPSDFASLSLSGSLARLHLGFSTNS
jgi:hypothetical protein